MQKKKTQPKRQTSPGICDVIVPAAKAEVVMQV